MLENTKVYKIMGKCTLTSFYSGLGKIYLKSMTLKFDIV